VGSLSSVVLIVIFAAAALATWIAGVSLSKTTDALDVRFDLGEEIGGLILLSFAGTLPELAITVSAAAAGHLQLAAGNLIGGIAIQTMVLVLCDVAAGPQRPLTFLVGALTPALEGLLVVLVVVGVIMGGLLPASASIGGVVSPASIVIAAFWGFGVWVINHVRRSPKWKIEMPGGRPGRRHRRDPAPDRPHPYAGASNAKVMSLFALGCAVTLAAGIALELTGNELAGRAGVNGVIFGATVLAFATALPEISSGLGAVRLGDHALAIGDTFGGNAFQVTLFLLADLVAGRALLPRAGIQNAWLAAVGIALTAIYSVGLIVRPDRCWARLGPDSILAIVVFALGIAGLIALPGSS
jgi:cation:H+ antiporter